MKKVFLTILNCVLFSVVIAQTCNSNSISIKQVRASETDSNIPFELSKHYSFYNPDCNTKNTLLIYMVGTYGNPSINLLFPTLAANNGFHVISLKYPNNVFAYQACGSSTDINCYKNFRHEALYGQDLNPSISIDATNSILNRATKLIKYLNQQYPTENWGQYLNNNDIDWAKVITSGHSQGAGHAAYIGSQFNVKRVLMFSGPLEYSTHFKTTADWFVQPKATPNSNYLAFGNINDEVADYSNLLKGWKNLGLSNSGDSINIDNITFPYNNQQVLYTSQLLTGGISVNHGSTVADDHTPKNLSGTPIFEPVWKYMLGINNTATGFSEKVIYNNGVKVTPNPFTSRTTITFTNNNKDEFSFVVYDVTGKSVFKQDDITGNTLIFNRNNLGSGIYFYNLINSKAHTISTGKLVVQ